MFSGSSMTCLRPSVPDEVVNNLRALLLGGEGAPPYAPAGLLQKKAFSVETLARAAGITRTSVYNYINNKKRPTPETLRRICAALEIPFREGLNYCTPSKVGYPGHAPRAHRTPLSMAGLPFGNRTPRGQ